MKPAALAVMIAAFAFGYAATGRASSSAASVPKCPAYAPKFASISGVSKQFVPPNARAVRLCRYYKNTWATGERLYRQRLIHQSSTIEPLTNSFNRLKEPPRGIFCVRDDGSEMQVIFAYAGGSVERVVVKLSGCRFASNGKAIRSTTAWLHKRLIALANNK